MAVRNQYYWSRRLRRLHITTIIKLVTAMYSSELETVISGLRISAVGAVF